MSETPAINLLVSLDKEASTIIQHFGLQRDNRQHAWPLYCNDRLSLIVSGMGKINAAAACAWLQAYSPSPCWINIGIAGHATAEIGSSWLVNKITDMDNNESWYPQTVLLPHMANKSLACASRPVDYESETDLYDMESSGFVSTASRFTTLEWIQLIKIVSDNRRQRWQQLDHNRVPELLGQALPVLEDIIAILSRTYPEAHPQAFDEITMSELTSSFHFSVTQRNELSVLLRRCKALDCCPDPEILLKQGNARRVLQALTECIGRTARNRGFVKHG